jgi:hypothetical protein
MSFPAGTYKITLGNPKHANFNGTLVVTPDTSQPNGFSGTYSHGAGVAKPVTISFATSPESISFRDTNSGHDILFNSASQDGSSNTFGPAAVNGVPSSAGHSNKDDDSWTAVLQGPIGHPHAGY